MRGKFCGSAIEDAENVYEVTIRVTGAEAKAFLEYELARPRMSLWQRVQGRAPRAYWVVINNMTMRVDDALQRAKHALTSDGLHRFSAAQERVRMLEEDRRRMDWLDRGNWQDALSYLVRRFGSYDDLRCAIDAALAMGAALSAEPKEDKL